CTRALVDDALITLHSKSPFLHARPFSASTLSCSSYSEGLHSFPTRRSSDLGRSNNYSVNGGDSNDLFANLPAVQPSPDSVEEFRDRKSTRLNSSHQIISYAVFCLKKKKIY